MALFRHADGHLECPLIGADRKSLVHAQNGEIDPSRKLSLAPTAFTSCFLILLALVELSDFHSVAALPDRALGVIESTHHHTFRISKQNITWIQLLKPGQDWRDLPRKLLPAGMQRLISKYHLPGLKNAGAIRSPL